MLKKLELDGRLKKDGHVHKHTGRQDHGGTRPWSDKSKVFLTNSDQHTFASSHLWTSSSTLPPRKVELLVMRSKTPWLQVTEPVIFSLLPGGVDKLQEGTTSVTPNASISVLPTETNNTHLPSLKHIQHIYATVTAHESMLI